MKSTLTSGICPNCNSNEIYTSNGNTKYGYRSAVLISAFSSFTVVTHLCLQCGYFEEYMEEKYLHNQKFIEKIKKKWKKL